MVVQAVKAIRPLALTIVYNCYIDYGGDREGADRGLVVAHEMIRAIVLEDSLYLLHGLHGAEREAHRTTRTSSHPSRRPPTLQQRRTGSHRPTTHAPAL